MIGCSPVRNCAAPSWLMSMTLSRWRSERRVTRRLRPVSVASAARHCAVKADIADGLHRGSDISIGELAARQRVTPRYIQMLFEAAGTTFTQLVLGEGLARAHRMLIDSNLPDPGIASVAVDDAFGDLAYFTR